MNKEAQRLKSPYGWEMIFAWCPPEGSPLLGATRNPVGTSGEEQGESEQDAVTRRYDRMAWLYDIYDAPMEWMGTRKRRPRLLARASGRVLEVGVGTARNLAHYPEGLELTGIDVSGAMMERARKRASEKGVEARLHPGDVTSLPYPNASFDTTVATCVFCSVADPVAGLRELGRVTKPGGRILLLEHVRPRNPLLGRLADLATVLTRRLFGFRANRCTERNIAEAELEVLEVRRDGVWREIVAQPPSEKSDEEAEG